MKEHKKQGGIILLIYFALTDTASDREKVAELYDKYKKKMFYVAYGVLKDSYAAEDAVHEAFIAITRNISKISDVNSPETAAYVCRAAKTRAINILDKKNRELEHGRFIEDNEDIPFEESEFERICAESEVSEIARCINKLPDKYRDVIVLHYLDNMPADAIADVLGRKYETVKKQLLRGRAILKNLLKEGKK